MIFFKIGNQDESVTKNDFPFKSRMVMLSMEQFYIKFTTCTFIL